MKLSIISDELCNNLGDAASIVREQRFEGIELYAFDGKLVEEMDKADIKTAKEILVENGLKVSCFASTVFLVCALNDSYEAYPVPGWPCYEGGSFLAHQEKFKQMAEYANILDAPSVRVFPFKLPETPWMIDQSILEQLAEKFSIIAKLAEAHDTNVCIETCPHSWGGSGMVLGRLLDLVNSPRLSILWDCGNSFVNGYDNKQTLPMDLRNTTVYEELEAIYPKISHIHLKDFTARQTDEGLIYMHVLFGTGCLDYRTIFHSLMQKNYDGFLSMEPYLGLRDAILSMKILKNLLDRESVYLNGKI